MIPGCRGLRDCQSLRSDDDLEPCFDCATLNTLERVERGEATDADLEALRRQSVQLSPAATPSKDRKVRPLGKPKGDNSWERGIAVDGRGMPLLREDGRHIGVKEYGEQRHSIEDARRRLRNDPSVLTGSG